MTVQELYERTGGNYEEARGTIMTDEEIRTMVDEIVRIDGKNKEIPASA